MELKFINTVIKHTLMCALLVFALFGFRAGFWKGLEFFLGALWSCGNLLLIKILFVSLFSQEQNIKALLYKFPLLYGVGYFLLTHADFPPWNFLFGFSLIFLVIFCHSVGHLFLKRAALFLLFFATPSLHASLDATVPEIPNIISLLHKIFHDSNFVSFLYYWETLVYSIFAASIISLLFYLGSRNSRLIPPPLQNFLECTVEGLRKFVLDILGPEGEKYVPFLGTLFLYILVMNWLVLIPLLKPPTSNFNITIALSLCVFFLVQYLNIKNFGLKGFLYHMAGSPKGKIGWALVPLMFSVELLTQITRPLTLALRLFGNVVGEDILIGAFALFGVYLAAPYFSSIGVPLQIPFIFLAILTGLMQALVFTLLSTIYILLSLPSLEDHH